MLIKKDKKGVSLLSSHSCVVVGEKIVAQTDTPLFTTNNVFPILHTLHGLPQTHRFG
jgi:hypothetical protein